VRVSLLASIHAANQFKQNTTAICMYINQCLLGLHVHVVQDCHVDKLVLCLCV